MITVMKCSTIGPQIYPHYVQYVILFIDLMNITP